MENKKGIIISEYEFDTICELLVYLIEIPHQEANFEKVIRTSPYAESLLKKIEERKKECKKECKIQRIE